MTVATARGQIGRRRLNAKAFWLSGPSAARVGADHVGEADAGLSFADAVRADDRGAPRPDELPLQRAPIPLRAAVSARARLAAVGAPAFAVVRRHAVGQRRLEAARAGGGDRQQARALDVAVARAEVPRAVARRTDHPGAA